MISVKQKVASFAELYRAMEECRRDVIWKDSVAGFVTDPMKRISRLRNSILDGTYTISSYSRFYVYEPKKRSITACKFKDRVFQRSLVNSYLYEEMTKDYIPENCACQKGKGTDYARNLLKEELRTHWRRHRMNGWVLQCDIHDFFGSTPHDTAKKAICRDVRDEWAREQACAIVDSFEKGIGLGSQVSQLIQLSVLSSLDHMVKDCYPNVLYMRYMDDFILISDSKEELRRVRRSVEQHLSQLGLELNVKKTKLIPISQPIHILGFSFLLHRTGRVTMKILPKNVKRMKKRLRKMTAKGIGIEDSYASWRGHAKKSDSRGTIRRCDMFKEKLGGTYHGLQNRKTETGRSRKTDEAEPRRSKPNR